MDGRANTSAENGKKGGRPKGFSAIQAEKTREYIAHRIAEEQEPIVNALIDKAKTGDVPAFKELMDRGFGKVRETMDITTDGEKIVFIPAELHGKRGLAQSPGDDS